MPTIKNIYILTEPIPKGKVCNWIILGIKVLEEICF